MQGFGVHTFRLVNAGGQASLVKFHWSPVLGTHSLDWDEAVRINGADPDFHRRDLWEAIEGGAYPEYLLQLQVFSEDDAERFSFDVLDATKIVPEELVPLRTVGRMVLDRNPDNFFAETEQIAFCTQHVIPGIDFTNDPLLQGRNFSYLDTQLLRLGGPNFAQIPINAPVVETFNNQRDGLHQHQIHRGRANYEPNSLGGGCPFQAGAAGFQSFAQRLREHQAGVEPAKLRAHPEKFGDHYTQARLFYASQTPVEQMHIARAFRFELTRVQTEAVRERTVALLRNVDEGLAARVAEDLGMTLPDALPAVVPVNESPEVAVSPSLSLTARPGDGRPLARRVALLVADGIASNGLDALYAALLDAGAVPRYVGARLGTVRTTDGEPWPVEVTLETAPSVLFDAVVLAPGVADTLAADPMAREFVELQYRHCKPMLVAASASSPLQAIGIDVEGGAAGVAIVDDAGLGDAAAAFAQAVAGPRAWERFAQPM
jgi:catalase